MDYLQDLGAETKDLDAGEEVELRSDEAVDRSEVEVADEISGFNRAREEHLYLKMSYHLQQTKQ